MDESSTIAKIGGKWMEAEGCNQMKNVALVGWTQTGAYHFGRVRIVGMVVVGIVVVWDGHIARRRFVVIPLRGQQVRRALVPASSRANDGIE